MKAFRITFDKSLPDRVDAAYAFNLPRLECRVCTPDFKGWGQSAVGYPAFKLSFLNKREFNIDRYVTLDEFNSIRERIINAVGRRLIILPGAGIGELIGTAKAANLDDFTWSRAVAPDISKRARDLLAGEGVELLTAECSLRFRGRRVETQLTVQVEPVEMLTKESLERHKIKYCPRCENYDSSLRPRPVVPEGYMFRRSAWPEGKHLVLVRETCQILASEQFMEAVKKHNLAGIVFEPVGQFV